MTTDKRETLVLAAWEPITRIHRRRWAAVPSVWRREKLWDATVNGYLAARKHWSGHGDFLAFALFCCRREWSHVIKHMNCDRLRGSVNDVPLLRDDGTEFRGASDPGPDAVDADNFYAFHVYQSDPQYRAILERWLAGETNHAIGDACGFSRTKVAYVIQDLLAVIRERAGAHQTEEETP